MPKILMIVTMIGIGVSAGVQPILGYCYGAKKKEKFMGRNRSRAVNM